MNELSMIFHRMGIDTREVLAAAGTKWNFLPFFPGLVGGHCIGVDPYYLTYKAEELGYHSQIILSGRRINDDMGKYIAESLVKRLIAADIPVKTARVGILGFTFKENCPDTRNTKVIDIIRELREYGIAPIVSDETADSAEAERLYGLKLADASEIREMDAVVVAVAHEYLAGMDKKQLEGLFKAGNRVKVLFDVKGIYNRADFAEPGFDYWRL
jgi:UDP-N-acetyl-D-galactosamine dehydrogenase